MKTVTVKKIRHLCIGLTRIERGAEEGIRVLVDGENIVGDDDDYFSSFRNSDYQSSDGYAVMNLLKALAHRGVLKLECDADVTRVYGLGPKQQT